MIELNIPPVLWDLRFLRYSEKSIFQKSRDITDPHYYINILEILLCI